MEVQNLDIEKTLRHVCKKVMDDKSVSSVVHQARVEALGIVGKIFMEFGSEKISEGGDFMKMVQESMQPGSSAAESEHQAQEAVHD